MEMTAEQVSAKLADIKGNMPSTYQSIQERAASGAPAYALVRRAIKGEPNCFWAMERGRVVGTPFQGHPIQAETARLMVEFACTYVCIWAEAAVLAAKAAP